MSIIENIDDLNLKLVEAIGMLSPLKFGGIKIDIEVFHNTCDAKPFDTGLHKHPFFELSTMSAGTMKYLVGETSRVINSRRHDFIFIPPETVHRRITCRSIPAVISGFQILISAADKKSECFIAALPGELRKRAFRMEPEPELANMIKQVFDEIRQAKPFFREKSALLINDFFIAFFRRYFNAFLMRLEKNGAYRRAEGSFHDNLISLACGYIEERLATRIRIDEIARYCGLCKRHLNRIFSVQKGISLGNYVIERKIDEARRRIMRNDRLIKDVALELGFENVSYFCRLFRKVTGKTPENYRRIR